MTSTVALEKTLFGTRMTPGQDANSIDKPVFYLLENDLLRFVISSATW